MNRRQLLGGASASALLITLARGQPVPLGGPVGYQTFPPGPLLGANQGAAPGNSPTLDLSFMNPGVLDPRITFTRASTGTYFDSTGTMQTAGLNLAIPSTNWYANATVSTTTNGTTQNAGIAPNGTNTAMLAVPSGTSGAHQWFQIFAGAVSTTYTQSIYAKAAGYNYLFLGLGNTGFGANATFATFDLINGVVSSQTGSGVNATIQAVGNGWYRCSISGTSPASGVPPYVGDIRVSSTNNGNAPFVGDMVSGLLLWGSQIEFGPVATQYAPTTTVANSSPRWDYDPVTLQLRGLLLEDQRTNTITQSGNLGIAPWAPSANGASAAPTVTANNITAPDGTLSAARIVMPAVAAGANASFVYNISGAGGGVQNTCSIWLRGAVGGETVNLFFTNFTTYFHSTLALTTAWRRLSVVGTPAAGGWAFGIGTDMRDATQTPNAAQTFYAWGAQVEAGAFPTSYIPTTAAAVTRARDACSVPVANITGYDATKGSLFIEYNLVGFNMTFNAPVQLVGSNAGTDYISVDEMTTAGSTPSLANIAGVSDAVGGTVLTTGNYGALGSVTALAGTIQKGASAWALSTSMAGAHNGINTLSATGSATSLPTVANLTIAGGMHFQNQLSLWARRVVYWPRALSAAEMQQVTT